jgi:uncharacterized phiE125 gp8 family phage protein
MIFDIKQVSEVATELLTLTDVKAHLYITHTNDDDYLTALITRVRKQIENYCTIAIGSQEKVWVADLVGNTEYQIPYQPVISVDTASQKTDYSTYELVTAGTDYDVDGEQEKSFTPFISGRFKVEYTTGFTVLPEDLKQAWLMQCGYLYENRGDEAKSGLSEMVKDIINPYRDLSWV